MSSARSGRPVPVCRRTQIQVSSAEVGRTQRLFAELAPRKGETVQAWSAASW
jgi:glycogen debranching enzyme